MKGRTDQAGRGELGARRSLWERARAALGGSAWAPLGGKAAGYVAGFFALALVGSGEALRLLPRSGGGSGAEVALARGVMVGGAPAPSDSSQAEAEGSDAGAPPADGGVTDAGAAASGGITADGKVVLNLATEDDLRRLPGVGPSKARAILAERAKLKRFRKVEDLLRVKGIGRRSLQRLRPLVLVDPP